MAKTYCCQAGRFCRLTTAISYVAALTVVATAAQAVDPMASNNGLYPTAEEYSGRYVLSNLDYPDTPVDNAWLTRTGQAPLTTETAEGYVMALKAHIGQTFSTLINDPGNWDPKYAKWYDMVWSGEGSPRPDDDKTDPTSGREALMNSYTGQIMPADTFSGQYEPGMEVQNHAVIYYNPTAAYKLGQVWADLYSPDINGFEFPEGSIVVKAEAIPLSADEWPILTGSSTWNVFRPSIQQQIDNPDGPLKAEVVEAHPLQLSIKIKDSIASPETGWVFFGMVYDRYASGETVWDKFVPVGAMWGNDPEYARDPYGLPAGATLKETWINPNAPAFIQDTVGWGGRLAGPMDVATRHNVITPSGVRYQGATHLRASSCLSCHGATEFPFTANLYPSPNKSFPPDGEQFLLFDPGSEEWAEWFQNRPGNVTMSENIGGRALDYDMVMMFALSAYSQAIGSNQFVQERFDVH